MKNMQIGMLGKVTGFCSKAAKRVRKNRKVSFRLPQNHYNEFEICSANLV